MKNTLLQAFNQPDFKFCYYTGQNDAGVAKILGLEQWDWTPQSTSNIEPWFWNTHTIPLTFGSPEHTTSQGKEWIEPLITDPQQVRELQIPDVHSGRAGEILNCAEQMLGELPETTLIRLPDIQSPLGVCELMWDQSFYTCLLTHPDEICILLDKVSKFIVNYIVEFQSMLGERYNPCCHPQLWSDAQGYYISDDANSMIPPDMHKKFSVDYINQITDECGPVFYHSCTFTPPYIENIHHVRQKKIINWSTGTSMDPAQIIKEFSGRMLLAPHLGAGIHKEKSLLNFEFKDEVEVFQYYLDSMQDNTTMHIVIQDDLFTDNEKIQRIYDLFHRYGYTPQAAGI